MYKWETGNMPFARHRLLKIVRVFRFCESRPASDNRYPDEACGFESSLPDCLANFRPLVLLVTNPEVNAIEQVSYSMTISANQSSNTHHKPLKLTLVLCGLLSACSDSSVSSPPTEPTNASEPLVVVGPSISAAQLANDNTVTVQNALALVTDEAVVVTRPIDLPAAANPDQTGTAAETTAETTAETATDPIDASTDNANAEPDSVITQVETEVTDH